MARRSSSKCRIVCLLRPHDMNHEIADWRSIAKREPAFLFGRGLPSVTRD